MALFPLISNFNDDFVLKLLPVDTEDTIKEICNKAAEHSVGVHVAEQPGKQIMARRPGSEPFPLDLVLADSDIEPMEAIEFYFG